MLDCARMGHPQRKECRRDAGATEKRRVAHKRTEEVEEGEEGRTTDRWLRAVERLTKRETESEEPTLAGLRKDGAPANEACITPPSGGPKENVSVSVSVKLSDRLPPRRGRKRWIVSESPTIRPESPYSLRDRNFPDPRFWMVSVSVADHPEVGRPLYTTPFCAFYP